MHPENQFEGFKESMSSWIGCSLKWVLDGWVKDSCQMSLGEESTCFDGDCVFPFMLKGSSCNNRNKNMETGMR